MANMSSLTSDIGVKVEEALRVIAEEQGSGKYEIVKVSGSVKGEGYLGEITRVRIDTEDEYGNKKHTHLIVKCAPKSVAFRDSVSLTDMYDREIYMYTTVFPELCNFQKEKCLPKPFSSIAKCYGTVTTEYNEAIILENLKEDGYDCFNRLLRMNGDHVELVLREYGKFHALSFALRDQHPQIFEKIGTSLSELLFIIMEKAGLDLNAKRSCLQALNALDPIADKEYYRVYQKFVNDAQTNLKSILATADDADDYSAVVHGDCWSGNMMFKYNEEQHPRKPSNVCFLDWQVSKLGPPVLDVSYFFYASSSEEVIDNFKYYLRQYYDSFASHLRALGSDPEKLYPFDKFEEQWKNHSKYGLLLAGIVAYVMNVEQDKAVDTIEVVESGSTLADGIKLDQVDMTKANKIMRHIIIHFIENNFI